jgi:hypothetical protein
MAVTHLNIKEIVKHLREETFYLYYDDANITWSEATTIPIDFAKFHDYPAEGIYKVELLLKIKKVTSKYEAIFCYFVNLEDEDNIFSIPFFKNWNKKIPRNAILSYNDKRCYYPLVNDDTTIENIELGTNLEITLINSKNLKYTKLAGCKFCKFQS